jgi:hypothetical protein
VIYAFDDSRFRDRLATLTRHVRVRVLNCSAEGCLLEATAHLAIGTVGNLRVSFGEREFDDVIQIVRCDRLEGASVHHVGAKFLSTTPPYAGTLRYTIRCDIGRLAGWLETENES